MRRFAKPLLFLLLSILSYLEFPGNAWLQQDTQIYTPILEHQWDSSVLASDILVRHPHVAFTIYDETALALRWVTHLDFHTVLTGLTILLRALGLWGVFLIATSLGLNAQSAAVVTLLWSLGATIIGPAVLTVEYEPVPRGFAVPLIMLAVGFAAHGRWTESGIAASVAFLFHPPSTYPYWLLAVFAGRKRVWPSLALAFAILLTAAHFQPGIHESQQFFERLTPDLERLQRMRASYNWISMWWGDYLLQYLFLFSVTMLAVNRVRLQLSRDLHLFAIGLPIIGMLSIPFSWLVLDYGKWSLMPQVQPMRALLFVTGFAVIFCAIAGCVAAQRRRFLEAFAWFLPPWLIPMRGRLFAIPPTPQIIACLALALLSAAVLCWPKYKASVLLLACYWILPGYAAVRNIPALHTAEITQLSQWARQSTPKDAVFFFPDNGKENYPGIFRSEALRTVYVDWKGGGQINFLKVFATEWWPRWQAANVPPFDPAAPGDPVARYRNLGIRYLAVSPRHALPGRNPVYQNSKYLVYSLQ